MDIVGLDLHKRESQLASKAPDGTITDRRIATSFDRLTAVFGDRPRARILLEASTESEWVVRHLELGATSQKEIQSGSWKYGAVLLGSLMTGARRLRLLPATRRHLVERAGPSGR